MTSTNERKGSHRLAARLEVEEQGGGDGRAVGVGEQVEGVWGREGEVWG